MIDLWLDDYRTPPDGWLWVTSVADAMIQIEAGRVRRASLDHDLGACDDCLGGMTAEEWLEQNAYQTMPHCSHVGTGYDLCVWMAENGQWPAEKPIVHSANAVGSERMRGVIDRYFPAQSVDEATDPSTR